MTVIGLIGRIGAGKSTVAQRFATHGAHVIDADHIVRDVLRENDVVEQIRTHFGNNVLDDAGQINRRQLADRVFGPAPAHATALAALESIVHPRVHRRIAAALAALQSRPKHGAAGEMAEKTVVVLDVPLLVQAGWADACDRLVTVECPEAIRRQRLAARHWSEAEQAARDAAWERKYAAPTVPPEKRATVDASGDLAYTWSQVDRIWSKLSG